MGLISRVSSRTYRFPKNLPKMAQGKMKVKAKIPKGVKSSNKLKHQTKKDKKFLRKGRLTIAPKKKQLMQNFDPQQTLKKKINHSIEDNVLNEAKAKGTTIFMINRKAEKMEASSSKASGDAKTKK